MASRRTDRITWFTSALLVLGLTATIPVLAACGSTEAAPAATSSTPAPSASSAATPTQDPGAGILPEGWIEGLPLPASAQLVSLTVSPDGANLNSIWTVEAGFADAAAAYAVRLGEAGLVSLGTIDSEGMITGDFAGSGLIVNVVTTDEGAQTGLLINATRE